MLVADLYAPLGYVVGSLALIADAYHMLNDAMSLVIALYAIKVIQTPAALWTITDFEPFPIAVKAFSRLQVFVRTIYTFNFYIT